MEVGAFSPRYYRCNKHTSYLVLRAAYGEDKIPLIKILIRTKKARLLKVVGITDLECLSSFQRYLFGVDHG